MSIVLKYKAALFEKGLSEATVNRRLAAVRALVAKGRALGIASFTLEDVKGEKVAKYRDTTGIDPDTFKRVLMWCDRSTLTGKRDYALLRLLWGNALRRNEVSQLNIGDFDADASTLRILGKGRGTQAEVIVFGYCHSGCDSSLVRGESRRSVGRCPIVYCSGLSQQWSQTHG